MNLLNRFLFGFLTLLATPAFSQLDLDVNGAKRNYENQQAAADRAKSRWNTAQQRYNGSSARLTTAKKEQADAVAWINQINQNIRSIDSQITAQEARQTQYANSIQSRQSDLTDAGDKIRRLRDERRRAEDDRNHIRREIEKIQREIDQNRSGSHTGDWTCNYVDQRTEEHRGGHPATNSDRAAADAASLALCKAVHGTCRSQGCSQPDDSATQALVRRRNSLRDDESRKNSEINSIDQKITSANNEFDSIQSYIDSDEREIRACQDKISELNRDRDRNNSSLGTAQDNLRTANTQLSTAQRDAERDYSDLLGAKQEYDSEQTSANSLYNYYQKVVANYNRELNKVYAAADDAAALHAAHEATDRAVDPAKADGKTTGLKEGQAKGQTDGQNRDGVIGYKLGRQNASSDPNLAGDYATGRSNGENLALLKAQSEDLPLGYNDALTKLLASEPSQVATVDITSSIPDDPGEDGESIPSTGMTPSTKPTPDFPLPTDTTMQPPMTHDPVVSLPARDNRYHNAPCENLILAEFKPLCQNRYDNSYAAAYGQQYKSVYTQNFRAEFETNARDAYNEAAAQTNAQQMNAGRSQGAMDQGVLDGFVAAITGARNAQYQAGQDLLASKLTGGHLLAVRSVEVIEGNNDGVLMPGEYALLKIVVDNLGLKVSPKSKLKLEIETTEGVETISFKTRELPALAANTRTVLIGATRLKVSRLPAGSKLRVKGQILTTATGSTDYVPLQSFNGVSEIHYPLELTGVKLSKSPAVNEIVKATFTFKNMSNVATEEAAINMATSPALVTVQKGNNAKVKALEPGATTTVDMDVRPTVWVGENSFVNFVSTTTKVGGTASWLTQPFENYIHLNRSSAILIFDRNDKPIPNSALTVKAGDTVWIKAKFQYFDTQQRFGPFTMRKSQVSNQAIVAASNSSESINYGSWGPGRQADAVYFGYVVPEKLRNTQAWIMLELDEGGVAIHAPMVYLNIQ